MGIADWVSKLGKNLSSVANTGKKYLGKGLGIFNKARTFGKNILKDPLVSSIYDFAKTEVPGLEGIEGFLSSAGKGANYLGKLVGADNAELSAADRNSVEDFLGGQGNKALDKIGVDRSKNNFDFTSYIRNKRRKLQK